MATLMAYEHLCPEDTGGFNQTAQRAGLPLLLIHQESTGRGQEETGRTVEEEKLLKTTTTATEEMNAGDTVDPWKCDKETETTPEKLDAFVNRWVSNELNHGTILWKDDYQLYRQEQRMRVVMTYFKEMRIKASSYRVQAANVPLRQATVPEMSSGYMEIIDAEREGFDELVRQGIPQYYIHQEMVRRELTAAKKQKEIERKREQERINAEAEMQNRLERIKSETRTQRRMRRTCMRDETLQWNGEDREAEERMNNLGRIEEETESKLQLESLGDAAKVKDPHSSQICPTQAASETTKDTAPPLKKPSKSRSKVKRAVQRFHKFTRDVWRRLRCKSVVV